MRLSSLLSMNESAENPNAEDDSLQNPDNPNVEDDSLQTPIASNFLQNPAASVSRQNPVTSISPQNHTSQTSVQNARNSSTYASTSYFQPQSFVDSDLVDSSSYASTSYFQPQSFVDPDLDFTLNVEGFQNSIYLPPIASTSASTSNNQTSQTSTSYFHPQSFVDPDLVNSDLDFTVNVEGFQNSIYLPPIASTSASTSNVTNAEFAGLQAPIHDVNQDVNQQLRNQFPTQPQANSVLNLQETFWKEYEPEFKEDALMFELEPGNPSSVLTQSGVPRLAELLEVDPSEVQHLVGLGGRQSVNLEVDPSEVQHLVGRGGRQSVNQPASPINWGELLNEMLCDTPVQNEGSTLPASQINWGELLNEHLCDTPVQNKGSTDVNKHVNQQDINQQVQNHDEKESKEDGLVSLDLYDDTLDTEFGTWSEFKALDIDLELDDKALDLNLDDKALDLDLHDYVDDETLQSTEQDCPSLPANFGGADTRGGMIIREVVVETVMPLVNNLIKEISASSGGAYIIRSDVLKQVTQQLLEAPLEFEAKKSATPKCRRDNTSREKSSGSAALVRHDDALRRSTRIRRQPVRFDDEDYELGKKRKLGRDLSRRQHRGQLMRLMEAAKKKMAKKMAGQKAKAGVEGEEKKPGGQQRGHPFLMRLMEATKKKMAKKKKMAGQKREAGGEGEEKKPSGDEDEEEKPNA